MQPLVLSSGANTVGLGMGLWSSFLLSDEFAAAAHRSTSGSSCCFNSSVGCGSTIFTSSVKSAGAPAGVPPRGTCGACGSPAGTLGIGTPCPQQGRELPPEVPEGDEGTKEI